jgi:carbon storage regulator
MLVLSRKLNEKIKLGEDIEIMIVGISGDMVRLGINAPRDLKILRSEIYEETKRQNSEAVGGEELGQSLQLFKEFRIDRDR